MIYMNFLINMDRWTKLELVKIQGRKLLWLSFVKVVLRREILLKSIVYMIDILK